MEATSFISTKISSKLFKLLTKSLKSSIDQRNKELVRINDVFGNCLELAKYYVQPSCQQVNPADELEDETISTIRAEVFETINKFFHRDIVTRDGASQVANRLIQRMSLKMKQYLQSERKFLKL